MARYVAEVDAATCIGSQMCVSVAPESYEFELPAGVSRFRPGSPGDESVLEGAQLCPVQAITVRDADDDDRQFYP